MPSALTAAIAALSVDSDVKSPLRFISAAAAMKSLGLFRPRKFLYLREGQTAAVASVMDMGVGVANGGCLLLRTEIGAIVSNSLIESPISRSHTSNAVKEI